MSRDQETRLPAGLPGAGPRQAMSLPHNIRPEQMVGPETPGEWPPWWGARVCVDRGVDDGQRFHGGAQS